MSAILSRLQCVNQTAIVQRLAYPKTSVRAASSLKGQKQPHIMMTSSNGNIFRVTALCVGNTSVTGGPVTRSFDVFFDLRHNG